MVAFLASEQQASRKPAQRNFSHGFAGDRLLGGFWRFGADTAGTRFRSLSHLTVKMREMPMRSVREIGLAAVTNAATAVGVNPCAATGDRAKVPVVGHRGFVKSARFKNLSACGIVRCEIKSTHPSAFGDFCRHRAVCVAAAGCGRREHGRFCPDDGHDQRHARLPQPNGAG